MRAGSKREARLAAALSKEPPARYARRRGRRQLVGVGVVLLALLWIDAGVCWALAPSDAAMYTTFAVVAVVLAVGALVWGTLCLSLRGTMGLAEDQLDERQLRDRLQAHATAHGLTAVLVFALYFVVLLAMPDGEAASIPAAALTMLFFALLTTVWTLPTLVAGWNQPDPPVDEE